MAFGITRASDQGAIWRTAAPATSEPPSGVVVPNSNKFKGPAGSLKKLLDSIPPDDSGYAPNEHPEIAAWLQKPTNAGFAKTYFKPGYKPVLQAVLGKDGLDKLNHHAPLQHVFSLNNHEQKPAPNSNKFKIPINTLTKVLSDPHANAGHFNEWKAKNPGFVSGYLDNPEYATAIEKSLSTGNHSKLKILQEAEAAAPKLLSNEIPPGGGLSEKAQSVADSAAKAFGPAGFKPMTQDQFFGPGGPAGPEHDIKPTGNPEPGEPGSWEYEQSHQDEPALKPTNQPSVNSPHYDDLKINAESHIKAVKDLIDAPGFHEWFHSHTKVDQADLSKKPGMAAIKFKKWLVKHPQSPEAPKLSPEDQGEAQAIKDVPPPGQPSWEDEAQKMGEPASEQPKGNVHVAIPAAINKVFPKADLSGMDDTALKSQLETWLKYLPDHEGYSGHVPKLQAVYDQFFGQGAKSPSAPSPAPLPPLSESPTLFQGEEPKGKFPDSFKDWLTQHSDKPLQELSDEEYGKLGDQYTEELSHQPGMDKDDIPTWLADNPHKDKWKDYLKAPGALPDDPVEQEVDFNDWVQSHYGDGYAEGDDPFSNPPEQQSFGDAAAEWFPQAFGGQGSIDKWNAMSPEKQKGFLKGWIDSGQGDDETMQKMQDFYDNGFGDNPHEGEDYPTGFQQWMTGEEGLNDFSNFDSMSTGTKKYWLDKFKKEQGGSDTKATDPKFLQWMNNEYGLSSSAVHDIVQQSSPGGKYEDTTGDIKAYLDEYKDNQKGDKDDAQMAQIMQDLEEAGWEGLSESITDMTPEQAKAKIQQQMEQEKDYGNEAYLGELQKLYDKHFGEETTKDPLLSDPWGSDAEGMTPVNLNDIPGDENGPDVEKMVGDLEDLGGWNSVIQDIQEKSPEEIKQILQKTIESISKSESGKHYATELQGVYDKYFPNTPAGGGAPEWNAGDFAAEYKKDFSGAAWPTTPKYQDPSEVKAKLKSLIDQGTDYWTQDDLDKFQKHYDKWFGGSGSDMKALVDEAAKIWPNSILVDHLKNMTPEEAEKKLQDMGAGSAPAMELLNKYFPGKGEIASGFGTPGFDHKSFLQGLVDGGQLDSWSAKDIATQTPEKFKSNYEYVKAHPEITSGPWPTIMKALDEGGAAKPAFSGQKLLEELTAPGAPLSSYSPDELQFKEWKDFTPEEGKAKLQQLIQDGYADSTIQPYIDKYFGAGAAKAQTEEYDSDDFQAAFAPLFPGSSWSKNYDGDISEADAQSKLKGLVTNSLANYPDSQKTKDSVKLYEKYFGPVDTPVKPKATPAWGEEEKQYGGGGSYNGDYPTPEWIQKHHYVDWTPEQIKESFDLNPNGVVTQSWKDDSFGDKAQYGVASGNVTHNTVEEPDDEAFTSAPFKGEELDPKDLSKWAGGKPTSAEQWKDFAAWWGKTKMAPEQEALLYNTWFPGKAASGEQAGGWFQQVFEHHSAPGGGDLGAAQMPGWAQNSWAFGKNAEKEWPAFSAWAAKDPGIPKNTTVKQKVAIWNGLSNGDKAEIAENYNPKDPIDTTSVVDALKKAYPDSDWSAWEKMPQGTLKNNVEMLAKSGYEGAIPVFNDTFGGSIALPEAKTKAKKEKPKTKTLSVIPMKDLPSWVNDKWGATPANAKLYTHVQHFADSVGQGEMYKAGPPSQYVSGGSDHAKLKSLYDSIPPYLKHAIGTMTTTPWKDTEGFKQWMEAQPGAGDAVKAIYPEMNTDTYTWKKQNGYEGSQQVWVASKLKNETDPAKKAALLGVYHKFFEAGKPTLGQSLASIYPDEDWDGKLKTGSIEAIQKDLKKKFKTEKDPEKWLALADTWTKYMVNPTNTSKVANTGVKQLTNVIAGSYPGNGIGAADLKKLHYWKTMMGGDSQASIPPNYTINSNADYKLAQYITNKANQPTEMTPPFVGWTPAGDVDLDTFQVDPAQLASKPTTYTAPTEGKSTASKNYQTLTEKVQKNKGLYSSSDQQTLASEEFQNWFNHSSKAYKEVFQHNPGVALDDYKAFMEGNVGTPEVPEGDGGKKVFDPSPFANIQVNPDKGTINLHKKYGPVTPKGLNSTDYDPFAYNKQRGEDIKFPRKEDEQETIPLPGGQQWAPQYKAMPIYRVMRLQGLMNHNDDPEQEKIRKQIVDILQGKKPSDKPEQPTLFDDQKGQTWPKDAPPIPSSPDQWMNVLDWAKKNGVTGEQMYDLAEKAGATPGKHGQPPLANQAPNWEDPRLGELLLDYMERPHKNDGGLGIHWTRSRKKAYEGVPSAGSQATTNKSSLNNLVVSIHGLWGGQGEDTSGRGGAYNVHSTDEREHTLLSHAPVHVRRLQIRSPDDDWHDTMDYGPMSLWDEGRDEDSKDKPSLTKELKDKAGVSVKADVFDKLLPGEKADQLFAKLLKDNPGQKKELDKIYQHYFVGRPDLVTKPHTRQASLKKPNVRTFEAIIDHLADEPRSQVASVEDLEGAIDVMASIYEEAW